MTVLKVSGLTKNFGGLAAVSNVNLEIGERELIGLIGPNGAGKTTLFNLLIPSGPAKVPMLIPLFLPVADALSMSRQVLCLAFQLGDGLTNYITPVSSVLAAALAMSGVNYGKWLRYVLPYVCITFVISVAALTFLQSIGWS